MSAANLHGHNDHADIAALIPFYGARLVTIYVEGAPHVAVRPIAEHLGLKWNGQWERIKRHPVLNTCVRVTRTQMPGDDQQREIVILPISMVHGWLFGVQVSRTRPELQELLTAYQAECFAVLDAYWRGGVAVNPRIHVVPDDEPWNRAAEGRTQGRRFGEERERWEREHGRPLAGVAGFTKPKIRAIEEHDGAIDRGVTQRILHSLGFDLRYIFFGERTLTAAERAIRDAYRLGTNEDRAALRRHAEAVRIVHAPDSEVGADSDRLAYAGADSVYYLTAG